MIDKVNGGKADAINAGLNAARLPADLRDRRGFDLEEHALTRAVMPFIEDPTTVAVGGIVRIANGCRVEQGRVTEVRLPRSWLAMFQVVEYLRAFLAARVTQSAFNALLIVSGAFGVYRRDIVLEVGGLRTDTVGEDMELVVAAAPACAASSGRPYRIVFQPDPVVLDRGARDHVRVLSRQRNRWQRGTLQVLEQHRAHDAQSALRRIGLLALPYYVIFEMLGPFD